MEIDVARIIKQGRVDKSWFGDGSVGLIDSCESGVRVFGWCAVRGEIFMGNFLKMFVTRFVPVGKIFLGLFTKRIIIFFIFS